MLTIFGDLIGWTVEAYVDDIVVKSKQTDNLVVDLDQTFKCLRAKNIKLNPEKYIFGIPRGILLGFIVSEHGIEANPEKISAITNMGPIQDLKRVQRTPQRTRPVPLSDSEKDGPLCLDAQGPRGA
jgi:hypothetical protein